MKKLNFENLNGVTNVCASEELYGSVSIYEVHAELIPIVISGIICFNDFNIRNLVIGIASVIISFSMIGLSFRSCKKGMRYHRWSKKQLLEMNRDVVNNNIGDVFLRDKPKESALDAYSVLNTYFIDEYDNLTILKDIQESGQTRELYLIDSPLELKQEIENSKNKKVKRLGKYLAIN